MVFEIVCGGCTAVLYSGVELKSAKDVLKLSQYGGKCNSCGTELSPLDFQVEVAKPRSL